MTVAYRCLRSMARYPARLDPDLIWMPNSCLFFSWSVILGFWVCRFVDCVPLCLLFCEQHCWFPRSNSPHSNGSRMEEGRKVEERKNNGICANWNKNTWISILDREMISEQISYKIPPFMRGKKGDADRNAFSFNTLIEAFLWKEGSLLTGFTTLLPSVHPCLGNSGT